jgi:hypothetical protein
LPPPTDERVIRGDESDIARADERAIALDRVGVAGADERLFRSARAGEVDEVVRARPDRGNPLPFVEQFCVTEGRCVAGWG